MSNSVHSSQIKSFFNISTQTCRKFLSAVAISFFSLIIIACSDSDSSSENNSNESSTTTSNSGAAVRFSSKEITAGDVITVSYDLGSEQTKAKDGLTGTIRWGDLQQTRLRGSGKTRYRYKSAGRYSVSLQVDGQESVRVGRIKVNSREVDASTANNSNANQPPATTAPVNFDCTVSASYPIVTSQGNYTLGVRRSANAPQTRTVMTLLDSTNNRSNFALDIFCPANVSVTHIAPFSFTNGGPTITLKISTKRNSVQFSAIE